MKIYGLDRDEIIEAFRSGEITVAVYGLGKMGLPLAAIFADRGAKVIGIDVDQNIVDTVNQGVSHVQEPGLTELVLKNVSIGRLHATTDLMYGAKHSDVMVIIVPTLLDSDNNPDLTIVTSVCESISQGLEAGDFVIQESTVPPRTTTDIIFPILEKSGLRKGDFGVAHCPERTSSGRAIQDITGAYQKIVGGIDPTSTKTAEAFYSVVNNKGVITVRDTTTAEAVKIFEGLYRDVNIALANQLSLVCEEIGVDTIEAFNAANTQPYSHLHLPGCGVGGHCIPIYPYFIIKTVKSETSLLELSRRVNDSMPKHIINVVERLLGRIEDSNMLLLGLTYRGGVKEMRKSPGIAMVQQLKEKGANVFAWDPLLEREEVECFNVTYTELEDAKDIDAVIIAADHHEFREIDWDKIGEKMRKKIVVDGRQVTNIDELREKGFICYAIGHI